MNDRLSYAEFIDRTGGGFYIYAPKQDPHLRKKWREPWSEEYQAMLASMAQHFHSHGVTFGVGLSPFGYTNFEASLLSEKLKQLQAAGVDLLGVFFDDMPVSDDLARTQIACVAEVRKHFKGELVFCPSYYTPDPILDKVFGQRPATYLSEIADGIPQDIELAWTGPKVISPTIDVAHMQETKALLKRDPYLWENIFANDGPKNCKFLKLKAFTGREAGVSELASAFAFNMMNQAQLSQITFLAARLVIEQDLEPEFAFDQALTALCSEEFAQFIRTHRVNFLEKGLDALSTEERSAHLAALAQMDDPGAREIEAWLRGEYVVGTECLTD
jgi:hypothetical protein